MVSKELIEKVGQEFKNVFPHGIVSVHKLALSDNGVIFQISLIGDQSLLVGGYVDNDPLQLSFLLEWDTHGKFAIEISKSTLTVKPTSEYYAMSRVKIPLRRYTGDEAGILKTIKKYAQKTKEVVKANADNIYQRDKYPDKYFK